jgi:hypothetical protein
MLYRVTFGRINVTEERIASIIRLTRIGVLETTLALTNTLRSVLHLLVIANVVPSSPILVTLMMEVILSSETSALIRATRRRIPEYGIPHNHRRENIKSYIT